MKQLKNFGRILDIENQKVILGGSREPGSGGGGPCQTECRCANGTTISLVCPIPPCRSGTNYLYCNGNLVTCEEACNAHE